MLRFDYMRAIVFRVGVDSRQPTRSRWAIYFVALVFSIFRPSAAHSEELCFDLSKRVTSPLMSPIALNEAIDTSASGERERHLKWGAVRGVVPKPIPQVLKSLLDPRIIKGPDQKGVKVTTQDRPGYLSLQEIEMTIRPLPFVSISWKEQWEYVLLEGTSAVPKAVLVSYQKTEGTSHIDRFCGSILVKALDDKKTDLFFYEEIKAARRSKEDIVQGHYGTLEALRKATTN